MENTNDKEKFELPTLWAYLKSDPSALLRILFPNSNGEFICRQLSDNKQVKCEYSKLEIISDLIKAAELEQEYDSKFNQEETEFSAKTIIIIFWRKINWIKNKIS